MNQLLVEVKKIGHLTGSLAILKAIRSKIELTRLQKNRLCKHFPNLKGVILTGRAGTGKTHVMKEIYHGLRFDRQDGMALWLDGAATTAGRREKLKDNPYAITFWNEVCIADANDVRLLKQLSEGIISYIKHGDTDETRFTGLIIGSTNELVGKGRIGKDIEALRDRIEVIEIPPPEKYSPELALEAEKHYLAKSSEVNWLLVAEAMMAESDVVLTDTEKEKILPFWIEKIRECLDGRVLTRSAKDFLDCYVFCKRFFGTLDDPEVFHAATKLAFDSVNLSTLAISNLNLVERDIIEIVLNGNNKSCTIEDIKEGLTNRGRLISRRSMFRNIEKLIEKGNLLKIKHGHYSMLLPDKKNEEKKEQWNLNFQKNT